MDTLTQALQAIEDQLGAPDFEENIYVVNIANGSFKIELEDGTLKVAVTDRKVILIEDITINEPILGDE